MEKVTSYVPGFGLGCSATHLIKVHTKFNFCPDKLGKEIEHRNRNTDRSKAAVIHVERYEKPNTYQIEFAHPDAQDDIYETIKEIEQDVEKAQRVTHLLGLVDGD